jgi:hypothetical protein
MQYSDYYFNQNDRIGADRVDNTQQNLQNTRFANHMLANYFSESITSAEIQFATSQPSMILSGTANGDGLNGQVVDYDSQLLIRTEQSRPLEKLSLNSRPFVTIPYLGRGTCNPDTESQLLQGESVFEKKGVSTIMDKSFMDYTLYPVDDHMRKHMDTAAHVDPEATALDGWNGEVAQPAQGWVRGGVQTRAMGSA